MASPPVNDLKSAAHELIDSLPDNSTWDDLIYRVYVRQRVEAGLRDLAAGDLVAVEEVRKRFGLSE